MSLRSREAYNDKGEITDMHICVEYHRTADLNLVIESLSSLELISSLN